MDDYPVDPLWLAAKVEWSAVKTSRFHLALWPIAFFAGVVVLLSYFTPLPALQEVQRLFLEWFSILSAVGLLIGLLNLARLHLQKAITRQPESLFSRVVILGIFFTITLGAVFGLSSQPVIWLYKNIVVPVETSLVAILAVLLVYIAARLFLKGWSSYRAIFFFTVLITLFGAVSFAQINTTGLVIFKTWLEQVWALGGLRGVLLGVVLGTVIAGTRILIGGERPYEAEND